VFSFKYFQDHLICSLAIKYSVLTALENKT